MTYRRALLVLIVGSWLVGGVYWALLNVPESNVFALLLSAVLVVMIAVGSGVTLALASGVSDDLPPSRAVRRALGALPLFALGLMIFGAIWFGTTRFDTWWSNHSGEADALFLRYLGFTGTTPLHVGLAWLSWIVRWVVGLSIVVALVAVTAFGQDDIVSRGLRMALRPDKLAVAAAGVLLVTQVLWRVAFWRPGNLPATQAEVYFAAAKLGVLYVAGLAIAAGVITIYRHGARRA